MHPHPEASHFDFLAGGGETGALMRAHNWTASSIGSPEAWPQSLRTVIALLLTSRFPMFIACGPDLIFLYNDDYIPVLGAKHPSALGSRFQDVWLEVWDDISPLIYNALAGHGAFLEDLPLATHRKGYRELAYFTCCFSPLRDETGDVMGIFSAGTETTGAVKARAALKEEKEHLAGLFRQAPGFMAVLRGPHHIFELTNAAFLQFFGRRDLIGKPARAAVPEVEGQGFFELLDEVYSTGEPFVGRQLPMTVQRRPDSPAEEAFIDFVYQPITGLDGQVTGIFIEGNDVTDRVWAAQHQQLLINELNHRVKNTLATVQSIVSQTLRHAPDRAEARAAIERRLIALSRAHDVLTRENWQGAYLSEMITQALEPFRSPEDNRFHVDGPEIMLSPRMALDLALALHELATNAVKYGALSNEFGEIHLTWAVDDSGAPPHLKLRWEERGGPPVVQPVRRGFGSRLIERSLAQALQGAVRIDFLPEGVICTVDAPIT
jgi:two-component sensor histidine kinase